MERLSHVIDESVASGEWRPISLSDGGPKLSHLFYADDLILFAEASEDQARVIRKCLDRFCSASGQNVSRDKSAIFCSKNTSRHVSSLISLLLGIPLTQNLGRYLGVPILHDRVTTRTYQGILDRIDSKLAGWKIKSLSLAGRVTMAQAVLAAIPTYAMQTSVLPVQTCEDIDRRIHNFVWGSTSDERKLCLVAWEKVCSPKEKGGLGLKLARELNRAFLTKLAFIFFKEKDKLWVRVLQHKYFRQSEEGLQVRNLKSSSPLWKGISREWATMLTGAKSAIRDGTETLFWTNNWADSDLRLLDFANTVDPDFDIDCTVASMTNSDGQWDFERLERLLEPGAVDVIAGMSPPQANRGADDWVWGLERSGEFSIKTAYNLICQSNALPSSDIWKVVWRWEGPNRIKHFIWLAANDKLLTNVVRRRRGFCSDDTCRGCGTEAESILHILRDCAFAKETWRAVGGFNTDGAEWQFSLTEWLQLFLAVRDWIRKDWELRLKHVYREANQAADFLANFGHGLQRGCHSVAISDCNLAYHIRYDALGISEPRLVN
ncbi:Putative ribonuclease H protein At1g65750 [Linum perenne]